MKILIAEDDPVSRRVLEMTLAAWGHETVVTTDGEAAWAVLQSADAPPLAILDVMMPHLDGFEVCRRVRALDREFSPYIILLTAKNLKQDAVKGLEAGADDYLIKPFDAGELRARVGAGARIAELQRKLAAQVSVLTESERRYRHLVENSHGLICTHDLAGTLLSVNPAAARALGYAPEEMTGRSLKDFLTPEMQLRFDLYLTRFRERGEDSNLMHVVTRAGEERVWLYRNARFDEAGKAPYVLGHAQDVTDLKRAETASRNLSLTDDVTNLYNRRGFTTLAGAALETARRALRHLLLFYLDMDGLKAINDLHGHDEGSRALVRVADTLRKTFRNGDIIARIGGDEFTVLATDAPPESVEAITRRLEQNLARGSADLGYALSVSVGVVSVPPEGAEDLEELMRQADAKMYEHKRSRRLAQ